MTRRRCLPSDSGMACVDPEFVSVRAPGTRREPFYYSELYSEVTGKIDGVRMDAPKGGTLLQVNENIKSP